MIVENPIGFVTGQTVDASRETDLERSGHRIGGRRIDRRRVDVRGVDVEGFFHDQLTANGSNKTDS